MLGNQIIKLVCVYCDKECKNIRSKSQHQRTCPSNADRHVPWNNGLTSETDERVAKNTQMIKLHHSSNPRTGCCSPEYLGSDKHKQSSSRGGGYRENAGRSKKFRVIDSYGKMVVLQSTYELNTSILLNEMNIKWIRPKSLKYDNKLYFADFYLPDYDIWLDPKNDYKAKVDKEKIQKVIEQNNIKLFILLKEQITKEYLGSLIQW